MHPCSCRCEFCICTRTIPEFFLVTLMNSACWKCFWGNWPYIAVSIVLLSTLSKPLLSSSQWSQCSGNENNVLECPRNSPKLTVIVAGFQNLAWFTRLFSCLMHTNCWACSRLKVCVSLPVCSEKFSNYVMLMWGKIQVGSCIFFFAVLLCIVARTGVADQAIWGLVAVGLSVVEQW